MTLAAVHAPGQEPAVEAVTRRRPTLRAHAARSPLAPSARSGRSCTLETRAMARTRGGGTPPRRPVLLLWSPSRSRGEVGTTWLYCTQTRSDSSPRPHDDRRVSRWTARRCLRVWIKHRGRARCGCWNRWCWMVVGAKSPGRLDTASSTKRPARGWRCAGTRQLAMVTRGRPST